MFGPITIPFESVMLFNIIKLKPDTDFEDVEMALAETCSIVKEKYSSQGFIAGQVFKYTGFISDEGSVGDFGPEAEHVAILTYWKGFKEHERSHADKDFKEKFSELLDLCAESKELGYELLWQGSA